MQLAKIHGWPELGFIVNWYSPNIYKAPIFDKCELILATHNGKPTYKDEVLLNRGFELGPQQYLNPNSGAKCSFFSGWRENVMIDDLIKVTTPSSNIGAASYQSMPFFCGIKLGPKDFYVIHKKLMEQGCGNIHILNPVTQKEDLDFFLKLGFEPVAHFKTGRILLARFFPEYLVKD